MSTANRVAKNTLILYARMGITVFISLYVTRVILAELGTADFGIFSLIGSTISMLVFLNAAMTQATQRFLSYSEGEGDELKQKQIFNASVVIHLIIGIILVVFVEIVGLFLFDGILNINPERILAAKFVFHMVVFSTFMKTISVPYDAVINAHENMLFVAILGVLEALFKLGIALYITYTTSDKLVVYGLLMASIPLLLFFVQSFYCHFKYSEVRLNIKKYFNGKLYREMTSFAGWSFLSSSSSMVAFYGQGVVLNIFFGTTVNAALGIANQVMGQLGAFSRVILKVLNPVITKMEGSGDRQQMIVATLSGSKISTYLLLLFYIPVIIEMPYIFKLWLNDVPEYSIIFCRLLLIKTLIEQFFLPVSSAIFAVGKVKKYNIYTSIFFILPIIISYIVFLYEAPPYYLYFVFIIFVIVNSCITLLIAKRECGLSLDTFIKDVIIKIVLVFIFTMLISSIITLVINEGVIRLITTTIISLLFFNILFYIFCLSKDEKIILKRILFNIPFLSNILSLKNSK